MANDLNLDPTILEKDYVLGWLLAGIYNAPALSDQWVFKGGTCLKKCYFQEYRFSEDLDFTLINPAHINSNFLSQQFSIIAEWILDHSGILFPPDTIRFDINPHNSETPSAVTGKIAYRGPLAPVGKDLPKIKLDLRTDERLILTPEERNVYFPYSDAPQPAITAICYPPEELFAEKIRAMIDRGSPRDLYDVINMFRSEQFSINASKIRALVIQKCTFKKIKFPTLGTMELHKEELYSSSWHYMLGKQLAIEPSIDLYWNELIPFFKWLNS